MTVGEQPPELAVLPSVLLTYMHARGLELPLLSVNEAEEPPEERKCP